MEPNEVRQIVLNRVNGELLTYLNDMWQTHCKEQNYNGDVECFTSEEVTKYVKICKTCKNQDGTFTKIFVYAFITLETFTTKAMGQVTVGEIFKPAGCNAPAKHKRGEVLDNTTWKDCFSPYCVAYR